MADIDWSDAVGFVGRIDILVLESLAEHIVKVAAVQMIGCGKRLCFRIEDDASLRAVVLHLDLHAGIAGSGGDEQHFEGRSLRFFGARLTFFLFPVMFGLPVAMRRFVALLLISAGGKDILLYLFQQIPADLSNALTTACR